MKVKSIILKCQCLTSVDSPRDDPSPGGDGGFYQAFAKHLLEFGREVEVLQTSVHGDEQSWQLQLPVLHHQMQDVVRLGVIGNSDILWKKKTVLWLISIKNTHSLCSKFSVAETHHGFVDESSTLELHCAKGVRRVSPGVFYHVPFILLGFNLHQLVCFLQWVGPSGDGHVLRCQLTTGTSE